MWGIQGTPRALKTGPLHFYGGKDGCKDDQLTSYMTLLGEIYKALLLCYLRFALSALYVLAMYSVSSTQSSPRPVSFPNQPWFCSSANPVTDSLDRRALGITSDRTPAENGEKGIFSSFFIVKCLVIFGTGGGGAAPLYTPHRGLCPLDPSWGQAP